MKYLDFMGKKKHMSSCRIEQIDKLNFYVFIKQVEPFLTRHYTEHTRLLLGWCKAQFELEQTNLSTAFYPFLSTLMRYQTFLNTENSCYLQNDTISPSFIWRSSFYWNQEVIVHQIPAEIN